jgi:hypothetical protein
MKFKELRSGYIIKFPQPPYYNLLREKVSGIFEAIPIDSNIDLSDPENKEKISSFRYSMMDDIVVLKPSNIPTKDQRLIIENIF